MRKLIESLKWIDNNLLHLLMGGFVFIVPLYPKFPIRIIDYTYIAVRAEDIYIALMVIVFLLQLIRKKVVLNKKFLMPILYFWVAVFASFVFGAYIQKTVIYKHLGFLHSARRVEYMIIFTIATSIVTSRKIFTRYLYLIILTLGITCIYGIGQKFYGWPAIQTMNPEFAKGHLLLLTPEARVSSTFAGHYDLAAYLVFLIPIAIGFYLYLGWKITYLIVALAIFILSLTASRISAIGAYPTSTAAFLLINKKYKHFIIIGLITTFTLLFSSNLINRVLKTVQIKQLFVNEKTGEVVVPQKISSKELPAGTSYIAISTVPKNDNGMTDKLLKDKLLEEIRKEASQSHKLLSASEEASLLATRSAGLKSQNTVVTDISLSTRLQVEWPRAINAFIHNPVFGAGPSAITESTDNDYLRNIGEFGGLGFILFALILYKISIYIWDKTKKMDKKSKILYRGYLFGLAGLLINAGMIDVFEASKVAYTFWMVSGMFIGALESEKLS